MSDDIELVIKISKKVYENIKQNKWKWPVDDVYKAIKNSAPLPKGHGRLGDLDAVMSDIFTIINELTNIGIAVDGDYLFAKLNDAIYNAQTIIEADKGEVRNEKLYS